MNQNNFDHIKAIEQYLDDLSKYYTIDKQKILESFETFLISLEDKVSNVGDFENIRFENDIIYFDCKIKPYPIVANINIEDNK